MALCTEAIALAASQVPASGPSGCLGSSEAGREFMYDGTARVLVVGNSSIEQTPPP